MKKTINISISGMVFHVEEDGYEQLYNYLLSIKNYFSSYEGSDEIIADIEARIAELFSLKLSDDKQCLTLEDVNELMRSMGTVNDFRAIEDEAEPKAEKAQNASDANSTTAQQAPVADEDKKLLRDIRKKLLGGVFSGLAYYFRIDAFWLRLAYLLILFGLLPLTEGISGPVMILLYVIFWVSVPASKTLGEVADVKKLLRNPDGKVLGGVANGIAAYFGVDVAVIRLLFVLTIFAGGTGLVVYVLIWALTPQANSITEKMQMKGDPITISNIENNIKEQLNLKDEDGKESTLTKLLLFPFRAIASIIKFLGTVLNPVVKFVFNAIRVMASLFAMFISLVMLVAFTVVFAVVLGLVNNPGNIEFFGYPIEYVTTGMSSIAIICSYIFVLIPLLVVFISSLSLLLNRFLLNAIAGWTFFIVWIISLVGIGISAATIASMFKSEATVKQTSVVNVPASNIMVVKIADVDKATYEKNGMVLNYDNASFSFVVSEDSMVHVTQKFSSRGKDYKDAEANARLLNHTYTLNDTVLVLDKKAVYGNKPVFRGQELEVEIAIPAGRRVIFDRSVRHKNVEAKILKGYDEGDMSDNLFVVQANGFECITCSNSEANRMLRDDDEMSGYEDKRQYTNKDFTKVSAAGPIELKIYPSDKFEIIAYGSKGVLENLEIDQDGEAITIGVQNDIDWDEVKVEIRMPELRVLNLAGATDARTGYFENGKSVEVNVVGAAELLLRGKFSTLDAKAVGASQISLEGECDQLVAEAIGASDVNSYKMHAGKVKMKCTGASHAKVNIETSQKTVLKAIGASDITYKGYGTNVEKDKDISSSIDKEED